MDYLEIINRYYNEDADLRRILVVHSEAVARRALRIADAHPELELDRQFLLEAAMLHDIGIIRCDAPKIHCHGTEPYIKHGILGAEMLQELSPSLFGEGWGGASRVCQRHTGAGITRAEIAAQRLPLPLPDDDSEPYMPETIEEKLICYADKFFSKTRPDHEKTIEEAERSLAKFGNDGVLRFREWTRLFE